MDYSVKASVNIQKTKMIVTEFRHIDSSSFLEEVVTFDYFWYLLHCELKSCTREMEN